MFGQDYVQRSGGQVVRIWTDGACIRNPGPGGWGVVILGSHGYREELSGGEPRTTNNRMEMLAAIVALEHLKPGKMRVTSDSQYLVFGASKWRFKWKRNGWRRGPTAASNWIKNPDLWRRLDAVIDRHVSVEWRWVRGHGSDKNNCRADKLATEAAAKFCRPKRAVVVQESALLTSHSSVLSSAVMP